MNDEEQQRLEAIGDQLRAKISSKFQTSTFLAGFALTVLSIEISAILQWEANTPIPGLLFLSVSMLLAAVVLFVRAIVRLDELTMPKLFWEVTTELHEAKPSHFGYLQSDDLVALKERMVFYWTRLTLVGTYLTAVSLVLILLPLPWLQIQARPLNTPGRWLAFTLMSVLPAAAFVYVRYLDRTVERSSRKLRRPVD